MPPEQMFETIKRQLIEGAKLKTFPGVSAAESDLLSGELEEAVTVLATMAGEQISHVLKQRKK
jgi:hypothetical protein